MKMAPRIGMLLAIALAWGATRLPAASLFDFSKNAGLIKCQHAEVEVVEEGEQPALKVVFKPEGEYPGITLPFEPKLDLSNAVGVLVRVTNPGTQPAKICLRVDDDGPWDQNPWNAEYGEIPPGATGEVVVRFGTSFTSKGYDLNPARITQMLIFSGDPNQDKDVEIIVHGLEPLQVAGGPAAAPEPEPAPTSRYETIWSDEFDIPGAPDPARWCYETGPRLRNNEASHYTRRPENARVEDGNLVIEARREAFEGSDYTSASLTTRETFPFIYGRVEVRAKIPGGRGIWPAIWMLGWHNEKAWWPEVGEIDLMEHVGFEPRKLFFTIHTLKNNHAKGNPIQSSLEVDRLDEGFHLYRLDWMPRRLVLSFDGREVLRYDKPADDMASWPFSNPMYLILNVTVGGDWGGTQGIDDDVFPARMLVDYVRVSRPIPAGKPTGASAR